MRGRQSKHHPEGRIHQDHGQQITGVGANPGISHAGTDVDLDSQNPDDCRQRTPIQVEHSTSLPRGGTADATATARQPFHCARSRASSGMGPSTVQYSSMIRSDRKPRSRAKAPGSRSDAEYISQTVGLSSP